jgi:hypothetical protein
MLMVIFYTSEFSLWVMTLYGTVGGQTFPLYIVLFWDYDSYDLYVKFEPDIFYLSMWGRSNTSIGK